MQATTIHNEYAKKRKQKLALLIRQNQREKKFENGIDDFAQI